MKGRENGLAFRGGHHRCTFVESPCPATMSLPHILAVAAQGSLTTHCSPSHPCLLGKMDVIFSRWCKTNPVDRALNLPPASATPEHRV